jgi:hypothetical protein
MQEIDDQFFGVEGRSLFDVGKGDRVLWVVRGYRRLMWGIGIGCWL